MHMNSSYVSFWCDVVKILKYKLQIVKLFF